MKSIKKMRFVIFLVAFVISISLQFVNISGLRADETGSDSGSDSGIDTGGDTGFNTGDTSTNPCPAPRYATYHIINAVVSNNVSGIYQGNAQTAFSFPIYRTLTISGSSGLSVGAAVVRNIQTKNCLSTLYQQNCCDQWEVGCSVIN